MLLLLTEEGNYPAILGVGNIATYLGILLRKTLNNWHLTWLSVYMY